ncbi:MAG: nitroreductase family protein [Candidatus Euphemobacter frigidus]|nr:nitroreductase family protein [Candidatus Euphemobacter frigidus]MDP8276723.1 nitroreductase family protein [Candidatus Euphemobacter frigidus]
MELFEAIRRRYSYRGAFEDKEVPREDLKKIVEAGLKAPSGVNGQTTTFIIVDDLVLVREIGMMHLKNRALREARALIACVIDRKPEAIYEGYSFQIEDCAAAVENMLLAITALGYGSVWIDGWLRLEGRAEKIGGLLGVPAEKIVRVILPVGVPVEEGPRKDKKPFGERAWFNSWSRAIK